MSELVQLQPFDQHNQRLAANVHPEDWVNPTPQGRYNLVVIGAGTAGLVAAAGAAGMGAKVALIERELMGGDCLNVGCVPSKALLAAARSVAAVEHSASLGVQVPEGVSTDFSEVMQRLRRLRADISAHDSAQRFRELGVDVFIGQGKFSSKTTIEVADCTLPFKRALIATGARAAPLPIPVDEGVRVLTNESLFSLTELPPRLAVIGGGPIGCEMAQAFALLGSKVTLFERAEHVLAREDVDAAQIVQSRMEADGVRVLTRSSVTGLSQTGSEKRIGYQLHGEAHTLDVDQVLSAIGRAPNVQGLQLEAAGVDYDVTHGVQVNDRLQTTNASVYAAGDIASRFKFTHAADFMARIVIRNALFFGRAKASALTIPWSTYTAPELAHVGLTPQQAAEQTVAIDTFTQPMSQVDRAILEGEIAGFARVHVRRGTDRIVGATVVGPQAGDLISYFSLAMTHGVGLKEFAATIFPYPTQAEAVRKLGDQFNRTRLTPTVKRLMERWLAWGL